MQLCRPGHFVLSPVQHQHHRQIGKAQRSGYGRGRIGTGGHDGGGEVGEQPDEQDGQGCLEHLFQQLGAVVGGHIMLTQEIAADDRRHTDEENGGTQRPESQLHAVHSDDGQRNKVRAPVQQQRCRQTDACKQGKSCTEDPFGTLPVVQRQLFRHHLGNGVGDTHRRNGQQHGVKLEARRPVAVADVTEAGNIDNDQIIHQAENFNEELAAQNGRHVIHKGILSFFHEKASIKAK